MQKYTIVTIKQRPDLKEYASQWFHDKWGIPANAYFKSMCASIERDPIQEWYLCLDGDQIIGGLGEIANDFHNRKDLTPNICAVYTEEKYRCKGIAGKLLEYAVKDNHKRGISKLYLITDHTGFYERYGWKFLCMVQGDGEEYPSRMYIHE